MHAELASQNPCAVPFLSRAAVKLYWYYGSVHITFTRADTHDPKIHNTISFGNKHRVSK